MCTHAHIYQKRDQFSNERKRESKKGCGFVGGMEDLGGVGGGETIIKIYYKKNHNF